MQMYDLFFFFSYLCSGKVMNMKKIIITISCTILSSALFSCDQIRSKMTPAGVETDTSTVTEVVEIPQTDSLSILVAGDLMQHQPQINAAYTGSGYDYSECFELVKEIVSDADVAIANFEVTLGGRPYKGYPCFSAPDEYLVAILNAGFDVLTTGNNHCLDTGKRGLERTIVMMDSLNVPHLGTYRDSLERAQHYPLIVEKNGFRIALLNFTYATNGLQVRKPNIVNYIDTVEIASDIRKAKRMKPDLLIALPHWGVEYSLIPAAADKALADWLFAQGVDHIIGGHPHVVQQMECRNDSTADGGNILVYSLGNYISNQYMENTTGGAMVRLDFTKTGDEVKLEKYGYMLTHCSRPQVSGRKNYRIVPVWMDEELNDGDKAIRDRFMRRMDRLFEQHNKNFGPYEF